MKYTGLLIILIAMICTWNLGSSENGSDEQLMHRELVAEVETLIRNILKDKRPELKEIVFRQLYTEVVKPGEEVKAHFRFEAAEGDENKGIVDSISEGTMLLVSNDQGVSWKAKTDYFGTPIVRFRDGTEIKASSQDSEKMDSAEPVSHDKPVHK